MLKIYDSLTGKTQPFTPIHNKKIKFYVCGNTVYDYCHIGHARSMIMFDVVNRYLRFRFPDYEITYVRNITDIDDKIIKRALENNETIDALTARFIAAQREDEQALGLLFPDQKRRATEYIPQMIDLIQQLIEKKFAYIAQTGTEKGDVLFDVRKFKEYGKLSGNTVEKLLSVQAGHKPEPIDFALWKISKPGEPRWPSPWGDGRPGWHIECSAMSTGLLGQPFDIHGGGMDLKFPHHENEIAQAEAACGKDFAKLWMHVGLLQVNGAKMSKSLENFLTIRDALAQYRAEELRFFMMNSLYNRPADYTETSLHEAKHRLKGLYTAVRDLPQVEHDGVSVYEEKFIEAMDDNFNTPIALGILDELATETTKLRQKNKFDDAAKLATAIHKLGKILGIVQQSQEAYRRGGWSTEKWQEIDALGQARDAARTHKNWAESDRLRQLLTEMGVDVEDTPSGTRLSRK